MAESDWDEKVLLDTDHLAEFTGGDPVFQNQVLKVFLDNAPTYLETLCKPGNENWRTDAHKLKGAARSIGAWRLAREAERAEQLGFPASDDPRRELIGAELAVRLSDTVAEIQARGDGL